MPDRTAQIEAARAYDERNGAKPWTEHIFNLLAENARLRGVIEAVRALADKHEHGALRWADPLPVPEWVAVVRDIVTTAEHPTPEQTGAPDEHR